MGWPFRSSRCDWLISSATPMAIWDMWERVLTMASPPLPCELMVSEWMLRAFWAKSAFR